MAYLVVKKSDRSKHSAPSLASPSKPYLKIQNGYFGLTTKTNTLGIYVKVNGSNYRVVETKSTSVTTTSADTYTSTTISLQSTSNAKNRRLIQSHSLYFTYTADGQRNQGAFYYNRSITIGPSIASFDYDYARLTSAFAHEVSQYITIISTVKTTTYSWTSSSYGSNLLTISLSRPGEVVSDVGVQKDIGIKYTYSLLAKTSYNSTTFSNSDSYTVNKTSNTKTITQSFYVSFASVTNTNSRYTSFSATYTINAALKAGTSGSQSLSGAYNPFYSVLETVYTSRYTSTEITTLTGPTYNTTRSSFTTY